jgi:hypothetical protein
MSSPVFVFHAHFYQPPRENPWTGLVDREEGAAPFHDWNARIDDECYRPNGFGRIIDDRDRVADMVNNYEHLSFNVGPTLLAWLERHDTVTLRRMIEADESTRTGPGRGCAIAQAYNHVILPLANDRDRRTQIRWGLAAFRHWFGREAEALWLPETAANADVMDDLIEHSMRFVILAPHQAGRVRPVKGGEWVDVGESGVDPSSPYLYRHRDGSGRSIFVFLYDGRLAHQLSFGDALESSTRFVRRAREASARRREGPLVHAAADGETAGHHTPWGDRVLAHALTRALSRSQIDVSSYAAILDQLEPRLEIEIDEGPDGEGTAWSCAHGVGRWIRDCGCSTTHTPGWNQDWRAGLRAALDLLRDTASPWFETEAAKIFEDPWAARDEYVRVILDPGDVSRTRFLDQHGRPGITPEAGRRGLELLELQHQLLLQYTSCGWFFDDIGGIESRQVLRYAARAIEIWEGLGGKPPVDEFLELLRSAASNDPRLGNGAVFFATIREEDGVDPRQLLGIVLLHSDDTDLDQGEFGCWSWRVRDRRSLESEASLVQLGSVSLTREPTGRSCEAAVAILRTGELDLSVHLGPVDADLESLTADLRSAHASAGEGDVLERTLGPAVYDTPGLLNRGTAELLRPLVEDEFGFLRRELTDIADRYASILTTALGREENRLMGMMAYRARQEELRTTLAALLEGTGELPAVVAGQLGEGGIAREALRPQVEAFIENALRNREAASARRAIELARVLGIPLYLHRAQEAWFETVAGLDERDSPRALGELLGFTSEFCADVVERRSGSVEGERQ